MCVVVDGSCKINLLNINFMLLEVIYRLAN